ncbi:MAG: hypothetical protein B6230_06315 [Desulfobacteraceae bacterium 4572_89]|nr:MAG: hypothetical protein B6230_06315 [Desulfobacteraceae bacterium 4572_89]
MKNYLKILLIIIILGVATLCSANPLSNIMLLFQKDLVIDVVYTNHRDLVQGSKVYLAENPKGQKVLIGTVKKISLAESQMSKVEIGIDKKHKGKIYETTQFVLMNNIFSKDSNPYIVAVSSLETSDTKPLKSGSSVKGITFIEYQLSIAGEELKNAMARFKQQNKELMDQLEKYIDNFNTEAFYKKMDELVNQISKFSTEQKEAFKKEVLPGLKKAFDSIMEKLKEQKNMEKSKDLEKRFQEIENLVKV